MARRVVVIGGDAAGMSAASQALRTAGPDALEVVVFERGHHVSYSACGIPYLVAGDVDTADALIARSAGEHRANGIDLRLRTEVTEIDLSGRTVTAAPLDGGASYQLGFDELVLATGAADGHAGSRLGYAPPFSPVWDPVLVAARKAAAAV